MTDKKIPRRLKLRENHPTYQKLLKLCNYAEDLGISLSFEGNVILLKDYLEQERIEREKYLAEFANWQEKSRKKL